MIILPTVRQLKYFIALAETLSFSKAAENSYVTQSTLSASIKDLESILGQTLFERSSRHVLLTNDGRELLGKAGNIIQQLQDIVMSMSKTTKPLSGKLRLGIIPTIAPFVLPELLSLIATDYPELDLVIEEGLSHIILDRLENGDLDVALIALPYDTASFEKMFIASDPFLFVTQKGKFPKTKSIQMDKLADYNLLLLEDGHCLKDHVLEACNIAVHAHNQNLRATSLDTVIRIVEKGLGETLIPEMAVKTDHYKNRNLTILPFDSQQAQPPQRLINLVWRKASIQSKDFELLGEVIKTIL